MNMMITRSDSTTGTLMIITLLISVTQNTHSLHKTIYFNNLFTSYCGITPKSAVYK